MGVTQGTRGKQRRSGTSYKLRQICDRKKRELLRTYGGLWCHLCSEPIDPELSSRDDDGLSWDHIWPVSTHPELAETASNLAPSHFACNRVRQDRPLDEINGTPERIEAFRALVAANRERSKARKALAIANREEIAGFPSFRHWCGPTIRPDGVPTAAWCHDDCPRRGDRRVFDQRTGRYLS